MGLEHNPLHRPERGGKAGLTVSLDCTQGGGGMGSFKMLLPGERGCASMEQRQWLAIEAYSMSGSHQAGL